MLRFIHTADIHFDTPFSVRFSGKQALLRRKEVMQTFRRIANAAKQANLFFISGDLFDSDYVSDETIEFLKRMFSEMPRTHVFIAAGNHDPFTANSMYAQVQFGENVHVFSTEMEYIDIPHLQVRIHGRSFSGKHEDKSLLESVQLAENFTNILVLHGEVVSSGGKSNYNPIFKEQLENCGMDYVALGHLHGYSEYSEPGKSHWAYPGIPEGRGFDELGEKGYISGVIDNDVLQTEFIPCSCRRFHVISVDLTEIPDGVAIADCVRQAVQTAGNADDIYRIILNGNTEASKIQIDFLENQIKEDAFLIEWLDRTTRERDIHSYLQDSSLKGDFVREMIRRRDAAPEEEKEQYENALLIGLDAMEGGVLS